MTFKELNERLNQVISSEAIYPWWGCPSDYDYEGENPDCPGTQDACADNCVRCWCREVPEETIARLKKELGIVSPSTGKVGEVDIPSESTKATPRILDSGARKQFESGAVRDIREGKGRCDLLPLDVVALVNGCGEDSHVIRCVDDFCKDGMIIHLCGALEIFTELYFKNSMPSMFLEVSKHFEEGAKKYGEDNWQKGIPTHCYIDSAVRHYLKYLRGDTDEPHDRAFCWNILCCIWTCIHKPELNDYRKEEDE